MKYLMLIYGNEQKWASFPAEAWPEAIARQDAFNKKYTDTGELIGAYGLGASAQAKLVRRQDGLPAVTGFTATYVMATIFLIVSVLAGLLIPNRRSTAEAITLGGEEEAAAP